MLEIREFCNADWPGVWQIIEPVFRAGDTYAFATDISEKEAYQVWIEDPLVSFVMVDEAQTILGTYFLKKNQSGNGSHVCNCGYIVGEAARGAGVASSMCEHSQRQALDRGFLHMQYNLVVASNTGAIRLWKKLGFDIVGTLPGAFNHPSKGFTDAHVMYKTLVTA